MNRNAILVGIDFSPESEAAAHEALEIARHTGDGLLLVHAGATIELPVLEDPGTRLTDTTRRALETYRSYLARALATQRERLGELRQRLAGQGPEVSQMMIEGFPADGLARAARELGADLTVVGTHGRTGLRWLLLGSVSGQLIRLIESDVLISRDPAAARGGYRRILVATDFSPSSRRALDRALWLAARGAEVDVVHFHVGGLPRVEPYDAVLGALGSDAEQAITADLEEAGRRMLERYRGAPVELRFHAFGEPATPGIIHWLERRRSDLVALGSHGRRGVRRFVLGSVAEAVARRAPCSVLVAHGARVAPVTLEPAL